MRSVQAGVDTRGGPGGPAPQNPPNLLLLINYIHYLIVTLHNTLLYSHKLEIEYLSISFHGY